MTTPTPSALTTSSTPPAPSTGVVHVPDGAPMPATITNGVRPSVEVVGRGEWRRRLRMAERNLAALDQHVLAHPEAETAVMRQRATYERIADDARRGLAKQNQPERAVEAAARTTVRPQNAVQSSSTPARSGASTPASTAGSASPSTSTPDIAHGEE